MTTNTLKINIPEGFEVSSFDKSSCEITLKEKPKNVTERIKSVADVLADHGLSQDEFDEQCDDLEADEVAYRILKMLAKSLNEGWVPNCNDSNEYKYVAWFYMGGSSGFRSFGYSNWRSTSDVGSRLCYKTRELAEHAGKNFTEVYKQFMVIN